MSRHNTIQTRGRCEVTGKIKYATRADAKKVRGRNPEFRDNRAYLYECGFHHLGHDYGVQDRSAHRTGEMIGSVVSVTMAATELNVTPEFIGQLIDAGAIDTVAGDRGQVRIPVAEVERLSRLTMRSA